jgi:hypothetical protein
MSRYKEPIVPFVEARHVGGSQKPTSIVLKMSSTTSEKGAAFGIANYHHKETAPLVSFHYIIDEEMTYRCVPSNVAAYGNPYRAINILMCAQPHDYVPLWEDATASRAMHRTADLIADLMLVHHIRVRNLRGKDAQRWHQHRWRRRGGLLVRPTGAWPHEAFFADVQSKVALKSRR